MTTRISIPQERESVEPTVRAHISKTERLKLLLDQNGRCAACLEKRALADLDLDHRVPLELGGADEPSNWQLICREVCHRTKTATDIRNIAKARRLRVKHGPKELRPAAQKIAGRGFHRRNWDGA